MAIDSALKRKSIAALASIWNGPVVVPSGTIAQADRQTIGYGYAGILAAAPANALNLITLVSTCILNVTSTASIRLRFNRTAGASNVRAPASRSSLVVTYQQTS